MRRTARRKLFHERLTLSFHFHGGHVVVGVEIQGQPTLRPVALGFVPDTARAPLERTGRLDHVMRHPERRSSQGQNSEPIPRWRVEDSGPEDGSPVSGGQVRAAGANRLEPRVATHHRAVRKGVWVRAMTINNRRRCDGLGVVNHAETRASYVPSRAPEPAKPPHRPHRRHSGRSGGSARSRSPTPSRRVPGVARQDSSTQLGALLTPAPSLRPVSAQ